MEEGAEREAKIESEMDDPVDENGGEVLGSSLTLEKVAAAKKFIQNHYRAQMKNIMERKERRWVLESKLASSTVPTEVQMNLIKDFELLTIIGRGAYGEASMML